MRRIGAFTHSLHIVSQHHSLILGSAPTRSRDFVPAGHGMAASYLISLLDNKSAAESVPRLQDLLERKCAGFGSSLCVTLPAPVAAGYGINSRWPSRKR